MNGRRESASHNSLVGSRIGRFEVVNEIGSGGMAAVYLARSVGSAGFQRLVAIKVMHPHLSNEDAFVEMFLDEARVAATIHHPNVVPIIDVGMEDDLIFLIMDYIEGDSLSSVEKVAVGLRRRIPLGIVLRVILDTLAGLHAAHELCGLDGNHLKIIHRDVSPQNIVIGCDGVSRIVDFGIAKAESRITTTKIGMLKGKLNFMAPEQLKSAAVDRRVDVFGMGVTLWEAVTLRRLYAGETELETAKKILSGEYPRLIDYDPKLPPALDDVCRRALAGNPDERFATAAAFADAIESKLRSHIASSRDVAQFIAGVAAQKIDRERRAVREFARDSMASPARESLSTPAPQDDVNATVVETLNAPAWRRKPTIAAPAMPLTGPANARPSNATVPTAPATPKLPVHEIYDDDGETALITRRPNIPAPKPIRAPKVPTPVTVGDDTEEINSESRTVFEPRYAPTPAPIIAPMPGGGKVSFPVPTTPASLQNLNEPPPPTEARERTMPISLVQRRSNESIRPEPIAASGPPARMSQPPSQPPDDDPFGQSPEAYGQPSPPPLQVPEPTGGFGSPLAAPPQHNNTVVYVLLSIALVSSAFAVFWYVTHRH